MFKLKEIFLYFLNMNKLIISLLLLSATVLCFSHDLTSENVPLVPVQEQQIVGLRNIKIIKDIRGFIRDHPNLQLKPLQKKTPIHRLQTVKYTLGSRMAGDHMVGQYGNSFFYPAKKNVTTLVTYPEVGVGRIVTSVVVNCLQDNNDGNAYLVDGGIGQRFISIVLDAVETERFSYNVHIYGMH